MAGFAWDLGNKKARHNRASLCLDEASASLVVALLRRLALASLEPGVRFVNDEGHSAATNHFAIFMAILNRFD